MGWPSTARAVPGNDQAARSRRVRTGFNFGFPILGSGSARAIPALTPRSKILNQKMSLLGLGVALVSRLKLLDKFGKEPGPALVAGLVVMVGEIATGAAEHLAHRRRRQIAGLGDEILAAEKGEKLLGGAEDAAVKGIDEKRTVLEITADDEMPGQADRLEGQAEALGDEEVDDPERKGDALAADEHLVEEAVERIGVMLDVAVKAVFGENHPVDHPAFFAGGGGLEDQLA